MDIDLAALGPAQVYGLMTQTLIPRPIAWVLSENSDGGLNLAPFSYFNAVCSSPPLVMISVGKKPDGSFKDTRVNIEGRRFTVAADALRPSDNSETMNLGGEFALNEYLFLRGGYKSLFRSDSYEGLTFGAGFAFNSGQMWALKVDYAYTNYDLMDDVHIASIGVAF